MTIKSALDDHKYKQIELAEAFKRGGEDERRRLENRFRE